MLRRSTPRLLLCVGALIPVVSACRIDSAGMGGFEPLVDASGDALAAEASCLDGILDQDESDIDCGGAACSKCGSGKRCRADGDCAVGLCIKAICTPAASCTNGIRDGSEADVDCGGDCPKCGAGKACGDGADCTSGNCVGKTCAGVSCFDGIRNGTETDIDCGGKDCPGCGPSRACTTSADCITRWCDASVCVWPRSCKKLHEVQPALPSAAYSIDPDGPGAIEPLQVYCEMSVDGGGWTFFAHVDGRYAGGTLFESDVGTYRTDLVDDGTTYGRGKSLLPWLGHTNMMVTLDSPTPLVAASAKKILFLEYPVGADAFNRGPIPCSGLKNGFGYRVTVAGSFTPGGTSNGCGPTDWYLRDAANAQYLTFFDYTTSGHLWGRALGGDDSLYHDGWWFAR